MSKVKSKLLVAATLALLAPLANAFVVIDVMSMPAAQVGANETKSTGAKITANAKANSEKEQATAKDNSAKEVATAIENTRKVMDQALFFAKQPIEWAKMVRDYATIAEGWPEPASSTSDTSSKTLSANDIKTAIQDALTAYGASKNAEASLASANSTYEGMLQVRGNEMSQRASIIDEFNRLNKDRAERMNRIENMLNMAEYQRDFDMVTTLLSMEQMRFASEQSALELSRNVLAENSSMKRELETAKRHAEFTDLRLPTAGTSSASAKPVPRVAIR